MSVDVRLTKEHHDNRMKEDTVLFEKEGTRNIKRGARKQGDKCVTFSPAHREACKIEPRMTAAIASRVTPSRSAFGIASRAAA